MVKVAMRIIFFTFIFPTLIFFASSASAKITARVDRKNIQTSESVNLIIESDRSISAQPNFDELRKKFQIGTVASGVSMGIVNGKSYTSQQWRLVLLPLRSGEVTIPAISVGGESTQPITIHVGKQKETFGQAKDVFFESNISTIHPYVQQKILYTLLFYYRYPVINVQSRLETPTANGKPMQLIEEPTRFLSMQHGVGYQVIEFHYVLFPKQSGELTISAPTFRGVIVMNNRAGAYGSYAGETQKQVFAKGKNIMLKIKPIPKSFSGKWWLPAQSITLNESWSASLDNLKIGDPVTRTISIKAIGVTENQLPEMQFSDLDGINVYPEKSTQSTKIVDGKIVATKKYIVAYVPTEAKNITIPEVTLSWWDTKKNKAMKSVLKSRSFLVKGAASVVQPEKPKVVIQKVLPPKQSSASRWYSWYIMLPLVLSGWFFGALALYQTRNKRYQVKNHKPENQSFRKAMKALKKACDKNDAKSAYQKALRAAQLKWPEKSILNLSHVLDLVSDEQLAAQIQHLNKLHYADGDTQDWDGQAFYRCFQEVLKKAHKDEKNDQEALPPIFIN